jgi:F-type H+-transporting ATPase subunit delta
MSEPVKIEQEIWDVSARRIARVYAESLLNAAEKQGQAEAVLDGLGVLIHDVLARDPRLQALFSSAALGRKARAEALQKAFEGRASDLFYRFLLVLNDHERLDLLPAILAESRHLYDERHRRLQVLVYSAVPLNDDQIRVIEERVRSRFQLEPVLVPIQDPALLGGLKIRIGDQQFDHTVRTRLDIIRQQLIERSSHEIQTGRDRFSTPV